MVEQTEYQEQHLTAEQENSHDETHDHAHGDHGLPESDFDGREYMGSPIVWTGFLISLAALALAGIVGGIVALLFFNYTTNGFS